MKKFFSLVLAFVMALSLTTVAWATAYPSCSCTGSAHVAAVGTTHYDDLQEAITAAASDASKTVTLLQNVTLSTYPSRNYWLAIEAPITFDGNGHTLTYNASTYDFRVFNIDTTGAVKIQKLTVSTTGERGFNVINQPVNLTLDYVTATSGNYTVNMAATADEATVAISNSTLTGKNVVNVGAADAVVTIATSTINCKDASTTEFYGALHLNADATGSTITAASTVTFNIEDNSKIGVNGADEGVITINGSADAVEVMVAEIKYGEYSYLFSTVQDAIDHAVNKDGASLSDPVEVIVLPAAVNSGESFELPEDDRVTLDLPADAGAEMVTLPNGEAVVVTPATFSGTTAITTSFKEDGTYYVLYNGIWDEVTYVPADDNGDGTGNVAYFKGDLADYIICKKNDDAALKLTSGFLAGDKLLNYVKVSEVEYTATATKVDASLYATCKTDAHLKGYKSVDAYGVATYYVDAETEGAVGNVFILVDKQLVEAEEQVEGTDFVYGGHALVQYKAAAKDEAKTVYEYQCVVCGAKFDGTTTKAAGVNYTRYTFDLATTGVAYEAAGYDMDDVEEGVLWLVKTKVPSAGGTTTTDKVTSAQTFDAGIAMYVGMSVMAAAGSVVVFKKRED